MINKVLQEHLKVKILSSMYKFNSVTKLTFQHMRSNKKKLKISLKTQRLKTLIPSLIWSWSQRKKTRMTKTKTKENKKKMR